MDTLGSCASRPVTQLLRPISTVSRDAWLGTLWPQKCEDIRSSCVSTPRQKSKRASLYSSCCIYNRGSTNMPTVLWSLLCAFFASIAALPTVLAESKCYYPPQNGRPLYQPQDTPCNLNTPESNCCAADDICLSNGLCWRANINHLHRGVCCSLRDLDCQQQPVSLTSVRNQSEY